MPRTPAKRGRPLVVSDSDNDVVQSSPPKKSRTEDSEDTHRKLLPVELHFTNELDEDEGEDIDPEVDDLQSDSSKTSSTDDLYLSPSPSPTKASPKETRRKALEALKRRRTGLKSANKVDISTTDETSHSEDGSESGTTSEDVDDDESEVQNDTAHAREDENYDEEYVLRHHFKVQMQYLVHLAVDHHLTHISDADKRYFERSVNIVERQTSGLAESFLASTTKAPFKAMLMERPDVSFEKMEPQLWLECAGCWQRGRYGCEPGPVYKVTSKRGTYDRVTLRRTFEDYDSDEYIVETHSAENNAIVPRIPYRPRMAITVGARCAEHGQLFHAAKHWLYEALKKIRSLFDEHKQPTGNPEAAFDYFVEENLFEPVSEGKK
ncbi:hypothetical protein DFH07DRAFT_956416 [Mycena maculata]|uniref:DUF4211 domain-containing protein n=1 Tax=Mycena maculata TaxID=230809 RepID=A0AAD7JJ53_9AGAR|nr:hypothetical protein DFH07DRAFT_956416 [Mycena maculata]